MAIKHLHKKFFYGEDTISLPEKQEVFELQAIACNSEKYN